MAKKKHHTKGGGGQEIWRERVSRVLQSQLVLGALVALLTVANAYVTYRSAKTSLASSTLDFYAAKEMHHATIAHLDGNARYMIDLTAFSAHRLLEDRDPELAENSLQRASEELLVSMERPGGPFDEAYNQARYGEARAAMETAQELYDQADQASLRSERYSLASTILAVGLGATAWAGLLRERNALRLVFSLAAVVSLVSGLVMASYFPGP
jgi:hypothetical protein